MMIKGYREMKPIKVGMLGLGTVGGAVVKIVEEHQQDLQRQTGCPVEITRVSVKDRNKPRDWALDSACLTDNPLDIVLDPEIDVVIEVMGGVEQTKSYVLTALRQGKHVVTANKDMMALHGPEILQVAREHQCDVYYEASVAGGIPILRTIVDGFSSDRITKMMGIVNGTTNFILSKMSQEGASYETVLAEAMKLGYAEADPTSDVEGLDAAYKMAILGTLGFHTEVSMEDVSVKGITGVSSQDILYGKRLGYEVKLLGIAESINGSISVRVEPTMVRNTHPLASVNGVFNAVYVYGEAVGETMFYGPGAGGMPTATSIVADLVAVCKNLQWGITGKRGLSLYNEKRVTSDEQVSCKNFLRLHVADKAGVLARIAQVFSHCDVSLEAVLQQADSDVSEAEITIITHVASRANMNNVLTQLHNLDVVHQIKSVYRVEG